jgi:hypothetical protein
MTPDPLREALERIAETHPSFCRCAAILTDDHDDRCPIAIARDALAAPRPDPLTEKEREEIRKGKCRIIARVDSTQRSTATEALLASSLRRAYAIIDRLTAESSP